MYPFWSPDSRFIGFFAGAKLKKIDASGGPPDLCYADFSEGWRGGSWNRDNTILFTGSVHAASPESPMRADSRSWSRGLIRPARTLDASVAALPARRPPFPLSRARKSAPRAERQRDLRVASVRRQGESSPVFTASSQRRIRASGHLLFVRERSAHRAARSTKRRAPHRASRSRSPENFSTTHLSVRGVFSVSDSGVLVYQTGSAVARRRSSSGSTGRVRSLGPLARGPAVFWPPDCRRTAIALPWRSSGPTNGNVRHLDLRHRARESRPGSTFDRGREPALRSGRRTASRLAFARQRKDDSGIHVKNSVGSRVEESPSTIRRRRGPGRLVCRWPVDRLPPQSKRPSKSAMTSGSFRFSGERKPSPLSRDRVQRAPPLSSPPTASGSPMPPMSRAKSEVYVAPFPEAGRARCQISHYRRDGILVGDGTGSDIFYVASDRKLMAAEVGTSPAFRGLALPHPAVSDSPRDAIGSHSTTSRPTARSSCVANVRPKRSSAADHARPQLGGGVETSMPLARRAPASGPTRSSRRSAPAGWERSTRRATRGSSGPSPSRSCRTHCR